MKRETTVVISLIGSQLVMIGSVAAIVLSPWYSEYFNQSLKEQSLENYRVNGSFMRSSSSAELARIFHKPGLGVGLEIHADEQMALEAIARRTGNIKQIVSKLRHHVDNVRKANDTTGNIADVALLKLIRVELAAADLYLAQGAYPRAQALVTAATEDLKRQSSLFEEEPQRFNLQKIFDLTARIDSAEGDTEGEQRAQALKATLANPAAASEWFRTHGMKGYAGSYPSNFLIKCLLAADNKNSKATTLAEALEVCKRGDVRLSTRTLIMQMAFNESERLHVPSLANAVVNFWMNYCAKNPIRFEPEAMLVYTLKDKMVRNDGTPESRLLIRSKVEEGIGKGLLRKDCAQAYFDSFETDQILCGLWPPKTPEAASIEGKKINDLLELCHKNGSDDFSLLLSKLVVLSATSLENETEIEKLFSEILDRMHTRSDAQSKIDQIRLTNSLGGVTNIMGKPHTKESNAKINRLLERLRSTFNFDDAPRLRFLVIYYEYIPEAEKAKREQCLRDIFALSRKPNLSTLNDLGFNFFMLHNIMIGQNRSDDGNKMMEEIRTACGSDSPTFVELSQRLLGYRRAYPSYNAETLKICREKPFPAKYFEDTPSLVAQVAGKQSARYCRVVLWLSQFEYCRGNNDRALQLSNEILKTPGVERMDSYLAAKDLRIQILGEKPSHLEGEVTAAPDSLLELLCLSNIYSQLGKPDAAARVDALRARVREKQ